MANDVAQRDLDQAGFRIMNLSDPKAAGDATKTDNTTVPLAPTGAGSPGKSLLAAPADHVHPASPGQGSSTVLQADDPTEQSVAGANEELVSELMFNFAAFGQPQALVAVAALAKVTEGTAKLRLRTGGTPGLPDGTEVLATSTNATSFASVGAATGPVALPIGLQTVKVTVQNDRPTATANVRAKVVTFSAGSAISQN